MFSHVMILFPVMSSMFNQVVKENKFWEEYKKKYIYKKFKIICEYHGS